MKTVRNSDGELDFYVYNYAEGGPKPGDAPAQSIRFDCTARLYDAMPLVALPSGPQTRCARPL